MNILFESVAVGPLKLKNRFVRSATQDYLGYPDGSISDRQVELYRVLAANNLGLIISGHAYVQHPLGRASPNQIAVYDDRFIPGLSRLADAVHTGGGKFILQVSHTGRQTPPDWPADLVPVAPELDYWQIVYAGYTHPEIYNDVDKTTDACLKTWAENRRRFLGEPAPTPAPTAPATMFPSAPADEPPGKIPPTIQAEPSRPEAR